MNKKTCSLREATEFLGLNLEPANTKAEMIDRIRNYTTKDEKDLKNAFNKLKQLVISQKLPVYGVNGNFQFEFDLRDADFTTIKFWVAQDAQYCGDKELSEDIRYFEYPMDSPLDNPYFWETGVSIPYKNIPINITEFIDVRIDDVHNIIYEDIPEERPFGYFNVRVQFRDLENIIKDNAIACKASERKKRVKQYAKTLPSEIRTYPDAWRAILKYFGANEYTPGFARTTICGYLREIKIQGKPRFGKAPQGNYRK